MVHAVAVAPGSGSSDANPLGFTSRSAPLRLLTLLLALLFGLMACSSDDDAQAPNILFVIMDDVGIDQMRTFGYGGETPPATPNIDRIAARRRPLQQHLVDAGLLDQPRGVLHRPLPVAHQRLRRAGPGRPGELDGVAVRDEPCPKLLKQRGYQSALFGKFHLGLQGNSPYCLRHAALAGLGLLRRLARRDRRPVVDRPHGRWRGHRRGVLSLRLRAGRGAAAGPTAAPVTPPDGTLPARCSWRRACRQDERCRDSGGIFDPNQPCQSPRPANIDFQTLSAHYVSPLVINDAQGVAQQVPPTDPRSRTLPRLRSPVDAADRLDQAQPKNEPWMATRQLRVGAHAGDAAAAGAAQLRPGRHQRARLQRYASGGAACADEPDDRGARHRDRPPAGVHRHGAARRRPDSWSTTRSAREHDGRHPRRQRHARRQRQAAVRHLARQGHGLPDRRVGAAGGRRAAGRPARPLGGAHGQHRRPVPAVRRDRRHRRACQRAAHHRFGVDAAVPERPCAARASAAGTSLRSGRTCRPTARSTDPARSAPAARRSR